MVLIVYIPVQMLVGVSEFCTEGKGYKKSIRGRPSSSAGGACTEAVSSLQWSRVRINPRQFAGCHALSLIPFPALEGLYYQSKASKMAQKMIIKNVVYSEICCNQMCYFPSLQVSQTRATFAWRPACSWWNCPSTRLWMWCWRNCDTPSTTARTLSAAEKTWQPNVPKRVHLSPTPILFLPPHTTGSSSETVLYALLLHQNHKLNSVLFWVNALHVYPCFFLNHSLHK